MALQDISDLEMMVWLRGKMNDCENEIRYIEELLSSTSGPADEIIKSLEVNRRMLAEYQTELGRYQKKADQERV